MIMVCNSIIYKIKNASHYHNNHTQCHKTLISKLIPYIITCQDHSLSQQIFRSIS